jgi:hypothetical protein
MTVCSGTVHEIETQRPVPGSQTEVLQEVAWVLTNLTGVAEPPELQALVDCGLLGTLTVMLFHLDGDVREQVPPQRLLCCGLGARPAPPRRLLSERVRVEIMGSIIMRSD